MMKKILSYLSLILLVGIYMLSTMGYGIHQCSLEGSNDIILLFGETPCEYVHSKDGGAGNCICGLEHQYQSEECAGGEHSNNCCSTETYVLSQDQVNSNNDTGHAPLLDYVYISYNLPVTEDCGQELYSGVVYSTGFVKGDRALHIVNSQFRI